MSRKVVFNIDDFCDNTWSLMDDFFLLKERYPDFRATLFTISLRISSRHLLMMKETGWIETAVHGFYHPINRSMLGEMISLKRETVVERFSGLDFSKFVRGFRAPYWLMTEETIDVCNQFGMWVAIHHTKNPDSWPSLARYGFYYPRDTGDFECWYGHTYDIKRELPGLLTRWPKDQEFAFVSEAVQFAPVPRAIKLNFGAGSNPKKEFINLDADLDHVEKFHPAYDMRMWNLEDGLCGFGDGSVEAATVSHALMFIKPEGELLRFFREVHRVLKPGGIFRVTEPDCESPENRFHSGYDLVYRSKYSPTGPRMMRGLLERVGFEVHEMTSWNETLYADNTLIHHCHGDVPEVFHMEAIKR